MPLSPDLIKKLETSNSVKSLRSELGLITELNKYDWKCHHSPFYRDPIENKLREIDVLGTQMWVRQTKRREETSWINLVIEAKSAKDWHLVFTSGQPHEEICGYTSRLWSGFIDSDKFHWLTEAIRASGVKEDSIPQLVKEFRKLAFTHEEAEIPPHSEPPNLSPIVTAFRETNTDKEKDLESSVFWRAITGLQSSTKALRLAKEHWHKEWFSFLEDCKSSKKSLLKEFIFASEASLGVVDVHYPILVVDSNLWLVDSSKLTQIPSCRFHQLGHTGQVTWWCDVVNASAFPSFINSLSKHYADFFKDNHFILR